MTTPRDGRTLPWTVLHRAVKPYALAVSFACAIIVVAMFTESGVGRQLDAWPGKLIGAAAAVVTVLLWAGWWLQSKLLMDHGLALATAVWAAVATAVLLEGSSWPSGWLAIAWAVASGGAYLLESADKAQT